MSRDQERDRSDHRNGDEDDDFDEDAILANLSPEQLQQLAEEVTANDDEEEEEEEEEATGSTDDDDDGDGDNGKEFDEDEILSALSKDQLRELERDLDDIQPDVSLPVGMRQKDQTEKIATGSYSHHSLIDYMQKQKKLVDLERIPEPLVDGQNKNGDGKIDSRRPLAEDEEAVDAESSGRAAENGTAKRASRTEGPPGHVAGSPRERSSESSDSGCEERERSAPGEAFARGESRSAAGGESASPANGVPNGRGSVTPPREGSSEPACATAADNADNPTGGGEQKQGDGGGGGDDAESFEPKAPLKLPGALANSLKDQLAAKFGALQKGPMGKGPPGKGPAAKGPGRLSGNPTIVDDALRGVQNNDPELTEVNLNNIENVPMETLVQFAEALKKNKHVKVFSIANTHSDDNVAYAIANMLRANRSIDKLNLESNFISGRGIVAIMRCLQFNEALLELRFHNQRHILGTQAEMEISRLLKANNTLLKMGYHFELPGPRMIVTNLLTRNLDRQRQQRLMEQRIQEERQQIRRMLVAGLAEMGEESKEGNCDEEEEEGEEEGWPDGLAASPRQKVLRGSQSLPASPLAPRSPQPPSSPVPAHGRKPRSVGRTQAESHRSSSASGEGGGGGGGWNMQGVLSQEENGAAGGPRLKKRPEGEKDSSSKAQSRFLLKREQHDFRHVLQPTRKRKVKQNPKPKENCIHEDLMSEIRTTNVAMLKMTPKSMEQLKEEYLK